MRFDLQAGVPGFIQHPLERGVRCLDSSFPVRWMKAPDICVHPCEPDLFQIDTRPGKPDRGFKILTLLINGQRVAGRRYIWPHLGIIELIMPLQQSHQTERDTQHAHRVPDVAKIHLARGMAVHHPETDGSRFLRRPTGSQRRGYKFLRLNVCHTNNSYTYSAVQIQSIQENRQQALRPQAETPSSLMVDPPQ